MWKLRCDISLTNILGHVLVWVFLGLISCGFAWFLFPYSFGRAIIDATTLVDQTGRPLGRLKCKSNVGDHVGHALLWFLLSICTLGIAAFFFLYRVWSDLLNATVVEPLGH
jgi:hypothetical protein